MQKTKDSAFTPILTVLAEPGPAYIWVVEKPDQGGVGPNMCDLSGWVDTLPMSHGLWQKFSDWAVEFDRFLSDFGYCRDMGNDWNWDAFHDRGMKLSRWLKDEVGDTYRVVYLKPRYDPNHKIDNRTEILSDGSLRALQPFRRPAPSSTTP